MPLYDFKCPVCFAITEERRALDNRDAPGTCSSCGQATVRIFSTFSSKIFHISFSDVAPLDDEGRPMSSMEAAKAGRALPYSPDATYRAQAHQRDQEERLTSNAMEQAKRSAWKQVSAQRRIVV